MIIWKGFEGTGCGLIEVLYWHLPGRTEENHEQLSLGWIVTHLCFEPSIS
jgi:hypothetical protein